MHALRGAARRVCALSGLSAAWAGKNRPFAVIRRGKLALTHF
jgi:hypothetical protein